MKSGIKTNPYRCLPQDSKRGEVGLVWYEVVGPQHWVAKVTGETGTSRHKSRKTAVAAVLRHAAGKKN